MPFHAMYLELVPASKSLVTFWTGEGFFTSVNAYMTVSVGLLGKSFRTVHTRVAVMLTKTVSFALLK